MRIAPPRQGQITFTLHAGEILCHLREWVLLKHDRLQHGSWPTKPITAHMALADLRLGHRERTSTSPF